MHTSDRPTPRSTVLSANPYVSGAILMSVIAITALAGGCSSGLRVETPEGSGSPPLRASTRHNVNGLTIGNAPLDTKLPVISAMPPMDLSSLLNIVEADGATVEGLDSLQQVSFAADGADFDPAISRDGKTIVFASTQHRPTADLYIKSIGSRSVTQLTQDQGNDVMPALSPDGQRVAFASDRQGSYHLYLMGISGGQAIQLTAGQQTDLHPTWSPDGSRLAFCRMGGQSGRWELWVLSIKNPTTPEFIGYGTMPIWCPIAGTGLGGTDKIAFQRARERGDRAFSIWTVDYKPGSVSNPTEIIPTRDGFAAVNPSFSPDGQWLAYAAVHSKTAWKRTEQMAEIPQSSDIRLVSLASGASATITGGQFRNVMPTWGVDGRVYFVSDRGFAHNVWSISTDRALAAAGGHSEGGDRTGQATGRNDSAAVAEVVEGSPTVISPAGAR